MEQFNQFKLCLGRWYYSDFKWFYYQVEFQ
nr:MAG TPA: hypothetical protein [Caudoviricetes sp.]